MADKRLPPVADFVKYRKERIDTDGGIPSVIDTLQKKGLEQRLQTVGGRRPVTMPSADTDAPEDNPDYTRTNGYISVPRSQESLAIQEIKEQCREDIPQIGRNLELYLLSHGYEMDEFPSRLAAIFSREEGTSYRLVSNVNFVNGTGDLALIVLSEREAELVRYNLLRERPDEPRKDKEGLMKRIAVSAGIAGFLGGSLVVHYLSLETAFVAALGAAGLAFAGWYLSSGNRYCGGHLPARFSHRQILARDDPERFWRAINTGGLIVGKDSLPLPPDETA